MQPTSNYVEVWHSVFGTFIMQLFEHDPEFPPGFTYIPDFISEEEEKALIELVWYSVTKYAVPEL